MLGNLLPGAVTDLIIKDRGHLRTLLKQYQQVGNFSLLHIKQAWESLCRSLTITKFI
jgi:hypothetical protein